MKAKGKRVAKTLYEKRGSRYVPVGKDDFILPYGVGDYLVRVRKGSKALTWRKVGLDVDHARLEIAMVEAAEALATAMVRESRVRPSRELSPREKKAFAAYKRIAGSDSMTMEIPSAREVAEKAVVVMRENLRGHESKPRPDGCADVYGEVEEGH